MTTQTRDQSSTVTITTYLNGVPTVSKTSSRVHREYFSKSDTTRRARPLDLFAGGTAITRLDNSYDYDITTAPVINGNVQGPSSYWAPISIVFPTHGLQKTHIDGKLRGKIKDQNVNLAQAMGEYRQTAGLFSDIAIDLFKTYRSIRSGSAIRDLVRELRRPSGVKRKSAAKRWLEYQYGILPLLSDLHGFAEQLNKKLIDGTYVYVRASMSEEIRNTSVGPNTSYPTIPCPISKITSSRYSVRGVARFKIQAAWLKELSEVGITNPIYAAWELMPYSFVIDWLFNVGEYLSSLDALNGVSDLRVIRGDKLIQSIYYESWGTGRFKQTSITRDTPSSGLAMPHFGYKPSESLTKIANGLALLSATGLSNKRSRGGL